METRLLKDCESESTHQASSIPKGDRWRFVRNPSRRNRYIIDPEKKENIEKTLRALQVAILVKRAACVFVDSIADNDTSKELSESVKDATGFVIDPDEIASIVSEHNLRKLNKYGRVSGILQLIRSQENDGINSDSLSNRQDVYGFNRYVEKPSRSFWIFVWEALKDVTLIILIVCAVVSLAVGYFTEGWPKGMYDGLGILISILLVVTVTAVSDYRQSLQFKKLDKEKQMIFVHVTRNGAREKVSIFDLVVGDIVHLSIGDQVPADGLYLSGYSLLIDESSLTGESEPVYISEEKPFLLSGTKVQDGSGKMLVTSVGMRTEWGKLMETLSQDGEDETPLQVKLNGVATIIGKIGLSFAILTFIVLIGRYLILKASSSGGMKWSLEDAEVILDFFATAVTIIVVAVPEGLPLAVTLSLAFAMKKLMDNKALVRHLSACETMGSASCICTDKTGTLTTNHMVVVKIWTCEKSVKIDHKETESELEFVPESVVNTLLQCIFLNSGSEVVKGKDGKTTMYGNPTECALLEFGLNLRGNFDSHRRDFVIKKVEPFNSVRKKMSVLVSLPGGGIRAFCKGASEIILQMCDKILDENGDIIALSEKKINHATDVINTFAREALRTLLVAFKDIDATTSENSIPTDGYTLMAVFGIKDPVRPGVKEAVEACRNAGITVRMVTGDNINTARAIAQECGILTDDGVCIEGNVFRNLHSDDMKSLIPKLQVMARSFPLDKYNLVKNLRISEVVAVTGDGSNDAPALHEADIGFAMGIAGTEVAKESADVIVLDDNFTTITTVVKWGRAVYINIQKFVQFQLTVNVVALLVNFCSACITGEAPLTAVQLLWVNMIMDTLGALALATEPPDDEMMKRPPVGRAENFITRTMWRNVAGQSIYQLIVLGILMWDGKSLFNISGLRADAILNTFIFNAFVFCQVFNEINSREMEKFNVFRGIFTSWVFSAIVIATVIFQYIIVEFLGTFASTVPLSWKLWMFSILIGFTSMPISILLKCIPVKSTNNVAQANVGYQRLSSGPQYKRASKGPDGV